jgi:hypothetical protein
MHGATRAFNAVRANVAAAKQTVDSSRLSDWFDTDGDAALDEEIIGLGTYGLTLTVLSSEDLQKPQNDDEEETDEEAIERWTPRFAYGR